MTRPGAGSGAVVRTAGPGHGSAIWSEFVKLTSVPSQRALLAVAVVMAALTSVLLYVSLPVTQGRGLRELAPAEILSTGILGVDVATFVTVILVAIHVGSEYSTGMIQSTLTLTPSRRRVLVGKLVSVAATALAVGTAAAALCTAVALAVGVSLGIHPTLVLSGAGVRLVLGSVAMPVLYSMIAAAAAFIGRSTAAGILVPAAVLALGGLAGWFGDQASAVLTPLMPVAALHSLSGVASGHEAIGLAGATASLLVWIGASVVAATWRFTRSDA